MSLSLPAHGFEMGGENLNCPFAQGWPFLFDRGAPKAQRSLQRPRGHGEERDTELSQARDGMDPAAPSQHRSRAGPGAVGKCMDTTRSHSCSQSRPHIPSLFLGCGHGEQAAPQGTARASSECPGQGGRREQREESPCSGAWVLWQSLRELCELWLGLGPSGLGSSGLGSGTPRSRASPEAADPRGTFPMAVPAVAAAVAGEEPVVPGVGGEGKGSAVGWDWGGLSWL